MTRKQLHRAQTLAAVAKIAISDARQHLRRGEAVSAFEDAGRALDTINSLSNLLDGREENAS